MTAKLFIWNLFEKFIWKIWRTQFVFSFYRRDISYSVTNKKRYSGAHLVSHECVGEATVESRNIIK